MAKVVYTIIPQRFDKYDVHFPADWEVVNVPEGYTDAELAEACKGADFLFVGSVHTVSAEVIKANPQLKLIQAEGVGFDKIDIQAAKELGIPVANNRGVNAEAVAEHTAALMLAGLRRIALNDRQYRHDGFGVAKAAHFAEGEHEIKDKVIGFAGMGAIAKEVVKRLIPWGCKFIYFDTFRPTPEVEKELGLTYMEWEDVVKNADIISMHVPVLPSTINMLGEAQFKAMKKTALVVNTARGEVIDKVALAKALEEGEIYGAALDVLDPEPTPADHPLLNMNKAGMDRLTLTTHIGGTTDEAFTRMLQLSIANIQRVINGEEPVSVVNK